MWRGSQYNLRGHKKATDPRFSTHFMKHSIRFRGTVLWNFVSDYLNDCHNFKQFSRKAKLDNHLGSLILTVYLCSNLVPRVSHLTALWGERGETLVWFGPVSARFKQVTNKRFEGGADKWGICHHLVDYERSLSAFKRIKLCMERFGPNYVHWEYSAVA